MQEEKRTFRSDKGSIRGTERDVFCITWIAEQYAARGDQIQRLLARYPDAKHPFKDGALPTASTTRDQINRWCRAGWIDYKRVLADGPGWAYVTRKGLQFVGLDEVFKAKPPASTRLAHIYAVNQVRLFGEEAGEDVRWESERYIRAGLRHALGASSGPISDAFVYPAPNRFRVAVEVQLSVLTAEQWRKKVGELMEVYPAYAAVWFYVPTEAMQTALYAACDAQFFLKNRLYCTEQDDLLMKENGWD